MEKVKVSIIVPIFNMEKTIEKCITALCNQTYQNVEIILVNDGSTDNTHEKVLQYNDTRIIYKLIENSGVSVARNIGLDLASGEFIMFCDPDDWYNLETVESALNSILSESADIVMFGYNAISNIKSNVIEIRSFNYNNKYMIIEQMLTGKLFQLGFIWNKIYSRDVIMNHRFRPGILKKQDVIFNTELILKKNIKIAVLNLPLYNYALNLNSTTNSFNERKIINDDLNFVNSLKLVTEMYDKRYARLIEYNKFISYSHFIHLFLRNYNGNKIYKQIKISKQFYKSELNIAKKTILLGFLNKKINFKMKLNIIFSVLFVKTINKKFSKRYYNLGGV